MKNTDKNNVTETPLTFRQKVENFLYHNKFWVIAAAFLIFVFVWMIVTGIGKNTQEAYIGYIGNYAYSPREEGEKSTLISNALSIDLEGHGKSEIAFYAKAYLSEEQIEEKSKEVERQGDVYMYSPARNESNYEYFIKELDMGDTAVWIVSHEVYERLDKRYLLPSSEALGYEHEASVDEYALDCSKLDFCTELMRENCLGSYIVIRAQRQYSSLMGTEEMNLQDEEDRRLYRAVVEYAK